MILWWLAPKEKYQRLTSSFPCTPQTHMHVHKHTHGPTLTQKGGKGIALECRFVLGDLDEELERVGICFRRDTVEK